ncbi:DUF1579 family protein [Hyphococcus flavus]|uniref:DUF1579 family protein n=1 Tax=Hyphococcus flavus TaxID=1866326 RepID=A0AAF0CBE2_9PROT|nr:DUF1579 family protein [Hyphococcus flavus]WDI30745.1 DUF1579 family protein [Hyphococcus flavus]
MKKLVVVLSLLAAAFGSTATLAQQQQDNAHQLAMQRLTPLKGEFIVEGVRHTPDGEASLRKSEAKIEYILNGYGLQDRSEADMGTDAPVKLLTTLSYDPYRKVYRVSVLDDTFGLMDIYEGRFIEENILAVTNLRADTYFPLNDEGDRLHFMLRWDMSADVKKFDVLMTRDGGASWSPYFEMTYTPKK